MGQRGVPDDVDDDVGCPFTLAVAQDAARSSRVVVQWTDGGMKLWPEHFAEVGADGTLQATIAGRATLTILAPGAEPVATNVQCNNGASIIDISARLKPTAFAIHGRVVDDIGQPPSDAHLRIISPGPIAYVVPLARDGSFAFSVAPGAHNISAEGRTIVDESPIDLAVSASERSPAPLEHRVQRAAIVRGRVLPVLDLARRTQQDVDEGAERIAVEILERAAWLGASSVWRTEIDDDGRFELQVPPDRALHLVAGFGPVPTQTDGVRATSALFSVRRGEVREIDLQLEQGRAVDIRVVDERGRALRPYPTIHVWLDDDATTDPYPVWIVLGAPEVPVVLSRVPMRFRIEGDTETVLLPPDRDTITLVRRR